MKIKQLFSPVFEQIRSRRWDERIAELDEERDAQEIVGILVGHLFPFEVYLSLEIAQLRTFTIPSISRLLHATRQYERDGVKRLDDTRAIMVEILTSVDNSTEQTEMIHHLNRIHGVYQISNDDYLYTLSTFIFDPWVFAERYAFRSMTRKECMAQYHFYTRVGKKMGIQNIPPGWDEYYTWRCLYEAEHQRYAPENEQVAKGLLSAAAYLVPPWLRPHMAEAITTLVEDPALSEALGLPQPSPRFQYLVQAFMLARKQLTRIYSPFEVRAAGDDPELNQFSTYPNGYERLKLGPYKLIDLFERQDAKAADT